MKRRMLLLVWLTILSCALFAQRVPVLNQISLPHNYYFRELYLPQLTSGPSSVTWSPDGKELIYSMKGSLWRQELNSEKAIQLTDDHGYDYQPDWSPDGKKIIFVRYDGSSCELMMLELGNGKIETLTSNKAVNLEPRWSPDGSQVVFVSSDKTGHFLLHTATIRSHQLEEIECITPDKKSEVARYYYSPYDHAVNPAWSRDGKKIYFVSNHEIAHGTGDIVTIDLNTSEIKTIHHEETSWRTRPDVSPDGTRLVYSSYLGRNWHQLWILPATGGYPIPLTYGEYDNSSPRWSPSGNEIAFISNREGNTSLWMINAFNGKEQQIKISQLQYKRKYIPLTIIVRDDNGNIIPARVSVKDSRNKFYAPANAWIQADDSRYPGQLQYEAHYFHTGGSDRVDVPIDKLIVQASHGPEYELSKIEIDLSGALQNTIEVIVKKQPLPAKYGAWWSGDLHVHMNYGGSYKNIPERLALQAEAENVNFIFNLIVNKEQRIPDIQWFTPVPDKASTKNSMILHAQEFHTSFWGHLGLLNLSDHFILPGYTGYPHTAVESLFPHNGFIADLAHEQNALVGYVHPFEQSEIFPDQSGTLYNELPVDIALGKVNYYELVGFSDHKASEAVWYKLLNCGFRIPAGAGTDAMANYASLRGPVGLNRVYVKGDGSLDHKYFLNSVAEGKSFVTNGPMIGFEVDGKTSGDSIFIGSKTRMLSYTASLRSQVPVDHFEVIWNGEVVAKHSSTVSMKIADVNGTVKVKGSGWLLVRAWSETAHPDLPDLYPYASTNPVFIKGTSKNSKQKTAAGYFLKWVDRIETKVSDLTFRNETEKQAVLNDVEKAKAYYGQLLK